MFGISTLYHVFIYSNYINNFLLVLLFLLKYLIYNLCLVLKVSVYINIYINVDLLLSVCYLINHIGCVCDSTLTFSIHQGSFNKWNHINELIHKWGICICSIYCNFKWYTHIVYDEHCSKMLTVYSNLWTNY